MEETTQKKIFAKGVCFDKLFLIFVIGCILGTYYEQILHCIKYFIFHGEFSWELRRGVLYGPFSPIYGFGLMMITNLLARKKRPWYMTFLYGALLGGGIEYAIHFLQEFFVGTKSWDYSNHFLNIQGRTTIPIMIGWGFGTFLFIQFIYPWISSLIEKISYDIGKKITVCLVVFLSLDMFISWTALLRQTVRRHGIKPFTFIGELYDKHYTDEYLQRHFPNMVFPE